MLCYAMLCYALSLGASTRSTFHLALSLGYFFFTEQRFSHYGFGGELSDFGYP